MENKNFYLKKVGHRGKIHIWIVNGDEIRTTLDPEFTNFGQHFHFAYIPENEFWIDKEAIPDERRFFIDHLITEWKLMKASKSYKEAIEKADEIEKSERQKSAIVKHLDGKEYQDQIKAIHKFILGKISHVVKVWIVDGKLVRSLFYIDFTEGGHHFVYKFVPKDEIWLDNDLMAEERPFVLLHETYERNLMKQGLTYNQAHRKASRLEWQCRHNLKNLDECLTKYHWLSSKTKSKEANKKPKILT